MSKQSDYALILLTVLAKLPPNTYMGLKEVAEDHNLPYKFIGQIATKLKKAKIVMSKEGSGGGYKLAKEATTINLNNIISALEGPIRPTACMRGGSCRCQESCQHQGIMISLTQSVITAMNDYTLADIVKNKRPNVKHPKP